MKRYSVIGWVMMLIFLLAACTPVTSSLQVAETTPTFLPTSTTVPATAAPTPTPVPDCLVDGNPAFTDYMTWTKVNLHPIKGHEKSVNVYVNDQARDVYTAAAGGVFPVCAMIVKSHLLSAESNTVTEITVMVKMPAGFDPEHNDWWWGLFDPSGKTATMSGKVPVCIACHQPAAKEDYVFSVEVMQASKK